MKLEEIEDKKLWEDFLSRTGEKTFLQSWNWGKFQKKMGEKIWRFGIYQLPITNYQLPVAVALVIKVTAKRGNFLFVPHGPIIKTQNSKLKTQILKELVNKLKEIAGEEKVNFIRIAPIWQRTWENIKIFKALNFREAPIHIHPELTWQLDITSPEKDLLRGMRKTTRNLIRRAVREEVKIYSSKDPEDISLFWKLYRETVSRHHFVPFSFNFLKKEFESFLPDNALLFFGKWKDKILSSALIIFWQKIAFYHQGASSKKFSKIPSSYLLQWEVIKEAKKRGCYLYNFWGIAPTKNPSHPWHGLTLFKTGFGGKRREYLKTQDLPLAISYLKNWIVEKIRKIKRRL